MHLDLLHALKFQNPFYYRVDVLLCFVLQIQCQIYSKLFVFSNRSHFIYLLNDCTLFFKSEFKNKVPASLSQQKRLRVCEVCSSYLGLNDDDKRLADHFNGKLHLGFLKIQEKYEELEVSVFE